MKFFLIAFVSALATGCSSQDTGADIAILRIDSPETPYKGFILNVDGQSVTFETCAGNVLQVDPSNLSYEGKFGEVECDALTRMREASK